MMKTVTGLAALLLSISLAQAQPAASASEAANKPTEPFKLIGNVYYVGTEGLAAYLVTSPRGHVLVDAGLAATAPLIEANIVKLGFSLAEVKYLLVSRASADRAGGLAQIQKDTGAQILAGAGDRPLLEGGLADRGLAPVKVDRVINDGDKLDLVNEKIAKGGVQLVARLMPGATPGCTSWMVPVREQKWNHTVIFFCGAFVGDNRLVGAHARPGIVEDYQKTFATARGLIADVFVAPYPDMFKMSEKRALIHDGWLNPFIKAGEFHAHVMAAEKAFKDELARQQQAVSADATAPAGK